MDLVVNHGNISIRDSKRVSVNLHRSKFKVGNVNHFFHEAGADFFTQEIEFSNGDGDEISITMFSDRKEDLFDPTKKIKEINNEIRKN